MTMGALLMSVRFALLSLLLLTPPVAPGPASAAVLEVPGSYASVQAAIDAAVDGDVVSIAHRQPPYRENLRVARKAITLRSALPPTGGQYDHPHIDGTQEEPDEGPSPPPLPVLRIEDGAFVAIRGLLFQRGYGGIRVGPGSTLELSDSTVHEIEGAGIELVSAAAGAPPSRAFVLRSVLVGNESGIEVGARAELWLEGSRFGASPLGVRIRFPEAGDAAAPAHWIRGNAFADGSYGIRVVDTPGRSGASLRIERNSFTGASRAAIDLACAPAPCAVEERVEVVHDTFVANGAGLVGGADVAAVNNVFTRHATAVSDVGGLSQLSHTLFHANAVDHQASNVDAATVISGDPLLIETPRYSGRFLPEPGSPALDAGIDHFEHAGNDVLDLATCAWSGAGPDLGAFERVFGVLRVPLTHEDDDGEETATHQVELSRKTIRLGAESFDGYSAFRFGGVEIPARSRIRSADLEFTVARKNDEYARLFFEIVEADDAPLFHEGRSSISGTNHQGLVVWEPPPWGRKGELQRTIGMESLLQRIVDRPGWQPGNAVAFVVSGFGGERRVYAFEKRSGAAVLNAEWDAGALDPDAACAP